MDTKPYRLGKRPARPGAVQFKLSRVLDAARLPARPRTFGHHALVKSWGMLANDRFGCCVWSGAAHETMLTNAASERSVPAFDDSDVLADYAAVTGFDPADPDTDRGTDMESAAAYRRRIGIRTRSGGRHRIKAYLAAKRGDVEQALNAGYFLGGLGIGFMVPDYAMEQFEAGRPWEVVGNQPAPESGHYVNLVGFDGTHLLVTTWGRVQRMSPDFYRRYNDESVAYVYPDYLNLRNLTPEGFDAAALDRMLSEVTGRALPEPVPLPPPGPVVIPPVTGDPWIFAIQAALLEAGFDPGRLDGAWGPRTKAAVIAFQRAHGLLVDGIVGDETSLALGIAAPPKPDGAFAGFDAYGYPGDAMMARLKAGTNLRWCGAYLGGSSSAASSWQSWHRGITNLRRTGWGIAPLWVGGQVTGPGSRDIRPVTGTADGGRAAGVMKMLGFTPGSCIYLDLENGPPFSAAQRAYVVAWCAAVEAGGYRPGVYCSYLFAAAVAAAVPRARIWVFHVRIATAHPVGGTTFPTTSPRASGFPGATSWQHENEARLTAFGGLAVDLNTSRLADPGAPDAALARAA